MDPQESLKAWTKITMLIENDWGEKGTGFLIKPVIKVNGIQHIKFFLVTCKHVLGKEPEHREQIEELTIYPLIRQVDGSLQRQATTLRLRYEDGSKIWKGHPNPNVDVMVFDVTELILHDTRIEHDAPDQSKFISDEWMRRLRVTTRDEVVAIGFPDIGRPENSEPILRTGTISTPIGKKIEFREGSNVSTLQAFAIDGEAIPGSSGSPVLLRPNIGRVIGERNYLGLPVPPLLLGVLAEATFAKVEYGNFSGWAYSGLGIAFDANTIVDTVGLYVQ